MNTFNSIGSVQTIETSGPWKSKSGGVLEVALALPQDKLAMFLDFDNPAFNEAPQNIRGLRVYTVSDIPKNSVGGKEWHKARTELISATAGSAALECVDVDGNEETFILDGTSTILIPPGILHTYQALEDGTRLQVIANTLFIPEDPATHDTFMVESFDR